MTVDQALAHEARHFENVVLHRAHAIEVRGHEVLTLVYSHSSRRGESIRWATYIDGEGAYSGIVESNA